MSPLLNELFSSAGSVCLSLFLFPMILFPKRVKPKQNIACLIATEGRNTLNLGLAWHATRSPYMPLTNLNVKAYFPSMLCAPSAGCLSLSLSPVLFTKILFYGLLCLWSLAKGKNTEKHQHKLRKRQMPAGISFTQLTSAALEGADSYYHY